MTYKQAIHPLLNYQRIDSGQAFNPLQRRPLKQGIMKNIIVFALLMMSLVASFGQPISTGTSLLNPDLYQKSKNHKTVALATGIPGVALLTIGGVMSMSEFDNGLLPGQSHSG